MFTGTIEETSALKFVIKTPASRVLQIDAALIPSGSRQGGSIAVNGTCLTVTSLSQNSFEVDVIHETMTQSCLGNLKTGDPISLEKAVATDGRLEGHIVLGRVGGTGTIPMIRQDGGAV